MRGAQHRLAAQPLRDEAWEPFGWLPRRDTDARDGASTLSFEWQDPHVNLIAHEAAEVPSTSEGLVCQMLFRHLTHTQTLLVLNCRAVIVVAPSGTEFSDPASMATLRAFLLHPQDSLVLHCGTWHWGPFPVDAPRVELFNVQGLRYAEDNDCADLTKMGEGVEVVIPRSLDGETYSTAVPLHQA